MNNFAFQPDVTAALRRVDSYSQVVSRSKPKASVWFFDSSKNEKRISVIGELLFMNIVILEGDTSVAKYVLKEDLDPANQFIPAIRVYREDGRVEWWDVVWETSSLRRASTRQPKGKLALNEREEAAGVAGATYFEKTEKDLVPQLIFFDNWLNLCAAITRCRSLSLAEEAAALHEARASRESFTLGELLSLKDLDPAHMLALIGLSLQRGALKADLTSKILGLNTVLWRAQS